MQPSTVLAFDTSAAHCAAALLLPDGRCLHRFEEMAKGQAEALMPMLEGLLNEVGLVWKDVSAIAVGTGPGNFTGVRISVAAARGLALALGVPAVGVTTLEALAHGLPRPVLVLEDARRGEVYVQEFTSVGPKPAALMALTDVTLEPGMRHLGSAAEALEYRALEKPLKPLFPLAEAIARIGAIRARTPQPRPAPFYLRGADAAPPSEAPPVILDA